MHSRLTEILAEKCKEVDRLKKRGYQAIGIMLCPLSVILRVLYPDPIGST